MMLQTHSFQAVESKRFWCIFLLARSLLFRTNCFRLAQRNQAVYLLCGAYQGKQFASENSLLYADSSAKDGTGVTTAFESVATGKLLLPYLDHAMAHDAPTSPKCDMLSCFENH